MFRLPMSFRAAAISVSVVLAAAATVPASAQFSVSVSFDNFHSRLGRYGTWIHSARWGEVWRPSAGRGFRPYYNGHWVDTREYGWLWVSSDPWGDLPYHYGRWVFDPRDGWVWVPGYVWGPSWVVWRSGGGVIGWFPMPPDDYYGDGPYRAAFDDDYGYRAWYGPGFGNDQFFSLWVFIGEDHFRDRDFRSHALPQRDYGRVIAQTRDTTNYVTINNYVVNRSVDANRLQRDTHQQFQPVQASSVISRTEPVTQSATGRQIEQRERKAHPIPASINPSEIRTNTRNLGTTGAGEAGPQQHAAPLAPVTNTPREVPQGAPGRGRNPEENRTDQVNPRSGRTPQANTVRPNADQTPQENRGGGRDRNPGGNGAPQVNPQTERVAPVGRGAPNPQSDRAGPAAIASPPNGLAATPRRGPPEQNGPAIVQGGRANTTGNRQGDAADRKAADEKKKDDDKKKNDGDQN